VPEVALIGAAVWAVTVGNFSITWQLWKDRQLKQAGLSLGVTGSDTDQNNYF